MSNYTLFYSPMLSAYTTNAPTQFYSKYTDEFNVSTIVSVDQKKIQSITLDLADTYAFTPGDLSTEDGCMIIAKVVGAARLKVTGTDLGAATTGYLPAYGTDLFPGYINLSTFNATAFELLGQADGTVIELFLGYAGGAVGFTGSFVYVFDGQGFSGSQSVTVNYSKVGRQVILDFPNTSATGATPGVAYITGNGTIPTNLWPEATGASLETPSLLSTEGSGSTNGAFLLTIGGVIRIYKNSTLTGNWTNGATIGWQRFTFSYVTAS